MEFGFIPLPCWAAICWAIIMGFGCSIWAMMSSGIFMAPKSFFSDQPRTGVMFRPPA